MKATLLRTIVMTGLMTIFSGCEKLPEIIEEIDYQQTNAVLRTATFNIEYNNASSTSTPWAQRKHAVKQLFTDYAFDIAGVQEPYWSQLDDLADLLPAYAYTGHTVMGSTTADQQLTVGILYKPERLTLLDSGMFWLSETPDVLSKGWNNSQYRICQWGKFKHKSTQRIFYYFSIHLDFDTAAYAPTLQLIEDRITQVATGYPVILGGDFNFNQTSPTYQDVVTDGFFEDTHLYAEELINPFQGTFTNYGSGLSSTNRIDHLFLANCRNIHIVKRKVITDSYAGVYPSDHAPVMAELVLPPSCSAVPTQQDTIREDFKRAVIKGLYPRGNVIAPSGLWLFDGALVYHQEPTDYRPMAPRLIGVNERGTPDLLGPGFIETEFTLPGLDQVDVDFVSMPAPYDVGPDFALEIQVSTDGGDSWESLGMEHAERNQIATASFRPEIPASEPVSVKIINRSPQIDTDLVRGNRINILGVQFIVPHSSN